MSREWRPGLVAAALIGAAAPACASTANIGTEPPSDAGTDRAPDKVDSSSRETGSLRNDGPSSTMCGSTLDLEDCPCAPGASARKCYSGPAAQAGVGACTFGSQSCASQSELGGAWGPCTGQGSVTDCTTTPDAACPSGKCEEASCRAMSCEELGDMCGAAVDPCGNPLDCGACKDGEMCVVDGNGLVNTCEVCTPSTCAQAGGVTCMPVKDSCGNLLDCGTVSLCDSIADGEETCDLGLEEALEECMSVAGCMWEGAEQCTMETSSSCWSGQGTCIAGL